jgi:hypothetical protein
VGPLRLAGVSVARSPGAAGVATAFLALATGLAVLAEAYRSTLETGEHDQAAFAVPADAVVKENPRALVPVLQAAPLGRYEAIPGVRTVAPVLRATASAGPSASVSGVTVLGVPQGAIERLPLWRDDWGVTRSELAAAVAPGGSTVYRGARLRGRTLRVAVGPSLLSFRATVEQRDGSFRAVDLGSAESRRPTTLAAPLPASARGGRLVALTLVPPHLNDNGAVSGNALRGQTTVRVLGTKLDGWLGEGGVTVAGDGDGGGALRVAYAVTLQSEARLRPRQPTDDEPPAAAVTPALASLAGGEGSRLPLRVGSVPVTVRVAAVVDRLPGTVGDAVLADLGALSTAIDAQAPGVGRASELWLDVDGARRDEAEAALSHRPFAALSTSWRDRMEADARRDPLGHGTLLALAAAAVAALVLAVAGLVLAVRADLRDDRGELADLEAQGATPGLLRKVVGTRAALVAAVGVAAGIVAGAALALLVTRVVSVTARADAPEPPLVTTVDPLALAVAAVLFAALATALVLLTTRRSFDDPRGPGRIGGEL